MSRLPSGDDPWRIHLPRDYGLIIKPPRAFVHPPEPPPRVGDWWLCPKCGVIRADSHLDLHEPPWRCRPLRLTEPDWLACRNPNALQAMVGQLMGMSPDAVMIVAAPASEAEVRCLVGNPFRPVTIDQAWLTWQDGTVRRLALGCIGLDGPAAPLVFAVLADALEESGCTVEAMLRHLREPGQHWPGCWVLRLLLGKDDVAAPDSNYSSTLAAQEAFRRTGLTNSQRMVNDMIDRDRARRGDLPREDRNQGTK